MIHGAPLRASKDERRAPQASSLQITFIIYIASTFVMQNVATYSLVRGLWQHRVAGLVVLAVQTYVTKPPTLRFIHIYLKYNSQIDSRMSVQLLFTY